LRYAGTQFGDDEVVQGTTVRVGQAIHSEEVLTQPAGQEGHVFRQSDGLGLAGAGMPQFLRQFKIGATFTPLVLCLFVFQRAAGLDGLISTIFQERNRLHQVLQGMKHIAATANAGQGQFLTGTQTAAKVSDGSLRCKTPVLQFEQTDRPGFGVAVLLHAQQVAIGRGDVGPDEYRLAALKDFVVGTDADSR
jgi:hypothetical protein